MTILATFKKNAYFHKNPKKTLILAKIWATISMLHMARISAEIGHFLGNADKMVFTDATWKYFEKIPFRVRAALPIYNRRCHFNMMMNPFSNPMIRRFSRLKSDTFCRFLMGLNYQIQ